MKRNEAEINACRSDNTCVSRLAFPENPEEMSYAGKSMLFSNDFKVAISDPSSLDPRPPDSLSFNASNDKEFASLLSVFLALPREELLVILEAARSAVTMPLTKTCGTPMHTCIGIGSPTHPLVMT